MPKSAFDEDLEHLYNVDARISIHDDLDEENDETSNDGGDTDVYILLMICSL